jgi:hypothetical protein
VCQIICSLSAFITSDLFRGDEPGLHNIPVDSSSINGSPDRASGGTNDDAHNTSGSTGAGGNGSQNRTSGAGRDGDEGPNRRGPGVGGNGGGGDMSTSRSKNDRLSFNQEINFSGGDGGGGGDDGGPTMVDGKWASPLHRTRVELSLKLNAGHTYAVNIGYTFKVMLSRIQIICLIIFLFLVHNQSRDGNTY